MLQNIIIHIGTEKTGSTSIQSFLSLNQELLNSNGYHKLNAAGKFNQVEFALYCTNDNSFPPYLARHGITNLDEKSLFREAFRKNLEDEFSILPEKIHTVIISSEWLHSKLTSLQEIEAVRSLLAPFTKSFEIICYIREQSQLVDSRYTTAIKGGRDEPIDISVADCKPDKHYYNYSILFNKWGSVFSENTLKVRLFDEDSSHNSSLIHDFIACIDPDLNAFYFQMPDRENQSFNRDGKALARSVNCLFPKENSKRNNRFHKKVLAIINESFTGKDSQITVSAYTAIKTLFQESNEEVRQRFFPDRDSLFEERQVFCDDPDDLESKYNNFKRLIQTILKELGKPS
jgi:hypothetical protein